MNQILVTGEERIENNQRMNKPEKAPKQPKQPKPKKQKNQYTGEKKVVSINKIVIFFAICIIVLGICFICGSIFAKDKINKTVEETATPLVEINKSEDDKYVEVEVSHIRGIKTIAYKWNDGEEQIINGNNQKNVNQKIDLIGGKNTLTVSVTEENGQTVTYQKEYSVGNVPEITLENVDNGVKLIAYAQDKIQYITYKWDDGEEKRVEIGRERYEGILATPKGRHTLKIVVVDMKNIPAEKTTTVIGATAPAISIKLGRRDNRLFFVINAEDEEKLSSLIVKINGEEKQNLKLNDKAYYLEVEVLEGDNHLEVQAQNNNGLKTTEVRDFNPSTLNR